MALKVVWTNFAKAELKNIFDYHKNKVSQKIAKQITKEIVDKASSLSKFPEKGVEEMLLIDKPQNFRYIISTNYKIIYWINSNLNRIEIVDVFDTRQNPKKIKREK